MAEENASITVDDLAKLLARTSNLDVTPEMIQSDIDAGAPSNDDGTIHPLLYLAWLCNNEPKPKIGRPRLS